MKLLIKSIYGNAIRDLNFSTFYFASILSVFYRSYTNFLPLKEKDHSDIELQANLVSPHFACHVSFVHGFTCVDVFVILRVCDSSCVSEYYSG